MAPTRNAWRHGDNKNRKYDDTDCLHDNKMAKKGQKGSKSVGNYKIFLLKTKYDIYHVCNKDIMSSRFLWG